MAQDYNQPTPPSPTPALAPWGEFERFASPSAESVDDDHNPFLGACSLSQDSTGF